MYPAILSCRAPAYKVIRLNGELLIGRQMPVSCVPRISAIQIGGEQKGKVEHR
ncbi:hypothetical protein HY29_02670 [Hyphomonas beringensis]|uniref:Uncharacterized protein n=1 Tax=Hyphomonas beringensis TaxID=1280946 RepID=A0A062UCW9_9PROT|nr:hypothetical protein HY29_02670 [Hyphomonas beringensis]